MRSLVSKDWKESWVKELTTCLMRRYCQKKMGKIGAKRPEKRRKIERKPRKTSMWLLICVISTRKRRRKSITG